MTDPALVAKKLALIESCLSDLRRLANPSAIDTDVREQRFVEHTLQIAIQAALDVASHIVSDRRLGDLYASLLAARGQAAAAAPLGSSGWPVGDCRRLTRADDALDFEPVSAALREAFERITAEGRAMPTGDAIAFARQHGGS